LAAFHKLEYLEKDEKFRTDCVKRCRKTQVEGEKSLILKVTQFVGERR